METLMNVRRIACFIFAALLMATGSGVHTQSTLPYAIIELRRSEAVRARLSTSTPPVR
jgi:hypothetical protein